jgi:outer membrane immunogenic protein
MVALAAAATFGMAGTAPAADVTPAPVYIPPPVIQPPPPRPFDGFYLGGHAGYGWANRNGCWDHDFPASEDCDLTELEYNDNAFDYDQEGWIAGAQVGYNHFFGDTGLLVGLEVSASLSGITGLLEDDNMFGEEFDEDFAEHFEGVGDWTYLATATAKIGYAFSNVLLYAEGGLGLGEFRYNSALCNFEINHQGWVVGAGVEAQVSTNNSLFVEYNHFDFNAKDASCGSYLLIIDGGAVYTDPTVDVLKVGFNHFFN